MTYLKSIQKNRKGFISIVALGIFALMAVFGIIAQAVAISTVKSVKNTKQYYEARDIADSVTEYLQWELSNENPGFNKDLIEDNAGAECDFTAFKDFSDKGLSNGVFSQDDSGDDDEGSSGDDYEKPTEADDGNAKLVDIIGEIKLNPDKYSEQQISSVCEAILTSGVRTTEVNINPRLSNLSLAGKAVKIKNMKIQGTSKEYQSYQAGYCPGVSGSCYVTPIMGTGDAVAEIDIDCNSLMDGGHGELDHPCNWNVLKHGSSVTDRVTIPLFNQEDGDVFSEEKCVGSTNCDLVLRIRPSCKEKYDQLEDKGAISSPHIDPCTNNRWTLKDEDSTKAIVQWQITGQCKNEDGKEVECGMINKIDVGADEQGQSSLINAGVINGGIENIDWAVLHKDSHAESTGVLDDTSEEIISHFLKQMKEPKLTLLLSSKLKADNFDTMTSTGEADEGSIKNPLYLEYQVLTSKPIASPKIKMDVEIDVDGTIFKKTLYKYEEKKLIDFAVQS